MNNSMKIIKKKITSSPNTIPSSPEITTNSPKVSAPDFSKWKEKMKMEIGGNFREKAERAGVPPEMVKDFKYWLRENKYE